MNDLIILILWASSIIVAMWLTGVIVLTAFYWILKVVNRGNWMELKDWDQ